MKTLLLGLVISAAAISAAQAAPVQKPEEASIPFVNHGGINDWRDDGRNGIYIQDQHRQWYRATFMGPCNAMPYAESIGFETQGADTFDRFGTVLVRGERCTVSSLVKSDAPPRKDSKKKHGIEKGKPAAPNASAASH